MGEEITRSEVTEQAGKLGFAMTGWIYEVMNRREDRSQPVLAEPLAAFLPAFRSASTTPRSALA
ncbi:hypothetical protein [Methylobacterium sp. GC_Met_2]|uniref:hypothetical protein n=1 Tax=Methylobacterium sp. GC_Met_2 TaxID=2937376 RepID=UPI00226B028E|nr:hypothetical protein [Methylobacterium sp. GC_Met_2]